MSLEATYRLAARLPSQYLNGTHRLYLVQDMNDIAAVAQMTAANATQAAASAAAAAASYALMAALGASVYGVGIDAMYLPRTNSLGSAAFVDWNALVGRRLATQNTTYNIKTTDFINAFLLTTAGTNQWNLPLWSSLPDPCPFLIGKNRRGNNLTFNPQATDSINGGAAGAAITIATGSTFLCFPSTTANAFEVAVFA